MTRTAPASGTLKTLVAALAFVAGASLAQAAPIATLYTGGDPGDGLDLQNDGLGFAYALDFRSSGGSNLTIGDATFNPVTASSAPAGVTVTTYGLGASDSYGFADSEFGGTTNDNNLESLAESAMQASNLAGTKLDLTLAVTAGKPYKLQLIMFGNSGAARPASYTINGITTQITLASTPAASPLVSSYVVTETFVATSSASQVVIIHNFGGGNDSFAQGLTLELLPEPASLSLVALGGMLMFARRKR